MLGDDTSNPPPPKARSRAALIGFVLAAAAAPLTAIILGVAFLAAPPPHGEPVASRMITSGEAFELTFVSEGAAQRVWLDMECEDCSLPVDGRLDVSAGDRSVKSVEISAGSEDDLSSHASLVEQLLTDLPAAPTGTQVTLRGVMTVRPERSFLGGKPTGKERPPRVNLLRIAIAP